MTPLQGPEEKTMTPLNSCVKNMTPPGPFPPKAVEITFNTYILFLVYI
jgi:hypothetical protein